MAIDFLAKRDILEQIIPSDAISTVVTSGVSGAWTATPIQIISAADLTYPFILCGAYVSEFFQLTTVDGTQAALMNLQIMSGAAGAQVPIAESHAGMLVAPGTAVDTVTGLEARTHFFEPMLIPAGTRLSCRATNQSGKAIYIGLYLFGYNATSFANPIKYIKELRYIRGLMSQTQGATCFPSGGVTNAQGNATAWLYGTPVQFIASATSPLLITGAASSAIVSGGRGQLKIGVGAAGSEVWMSKVGFAGRVGIPGPLSDCYLPRPLFVKKGEAVSVALATSAASVTIGIALKGFYLK